MATPVIRLIQMASEPGDLPGNRKAIQAATRGMKAGELALFPELALSGYMLRSGRRQAALAADSPSLASLTPRRGAALLGLVEQGEDHHLYNVAALLLAGRKPQIHRKTFLPTDQTISVYQLLRDYVELQDVATRANIQLLAEYTECPPHKIQLLALTGEDDASVARYKEDIWQRRVSVL